MKSVSLRLALAGIVLALSQSCAWAQWKWLDQNKRLHVSDRPPPADVPDKDILQRPPRFGAASSAAAATAASASPAPPAEAASGEAKPRSDPALEARRRAAEQDKRASEAADQQKTAAARADNCARAKSYLQTLDGGMRVTRTNAQGEREVLDDRARAQESQRTREIIARDCR